MGFGGCLSAICAEPGCPDIRVTDNYPCQDILLGAPAIVSSPMSNLRHKNGVGVERWLISMNRYLHLTVCIFLKTNFFKKAKSSEEAADGCKLQRFHDVNCRSLYVNCLSANSTLKV